MKPVLEVRDLVKQYPAVRAVDGVSFTMAPGVCFGLLGPNGAGKTTTVEIMEGVTEPTSGLVLYQVAIEAEYRAGIRPLREIGKAFGVSHVAIQKRADRERWPRDLKAKIRAKAEEKVTKARLPAKLPW